jgi:hypothetical protein
MTGEDDAYTVGVGEPLLHAFDQNGPDADNLHQPCAAISNKDSGVQRETIRVLRLPASCGVQ